MLPVRKHGCIMGNWAHEVHWRYQYWDSHHRSPAYMSFCLIFEFHVPNQLQQLARSNAKYIETRFGLGVPQISETFVNKHLYIAASFTHPLQRAVGAFWLIKKAAHIATRPTTACDLLTGSATPICVI